LMESLRRKSGNTDRESSSGNKPEKEEEDAQGKNGPTIEKKGEKRRTPSWKGGPIHARRYRKGEGQQPRKQEKYEATIQFTMDQWGGKRGKKNLIPFRL